MLWYKIGPRSIVCAFLALLATGISQVILRGALPANSANRSWNESSCINFCDIMMFQATAATPIQSERQAELFAFFDLQLCCTHDTSKWLVSIQVLFRQSTGVLHAVAHQCDQFTPRTPDYRTSWGGGGGGGGGGASISYTLQFPRQITNNCYIAPYMSFLTQSWSNSQSLIDAWYCDRSDMWIQFTHCDNTLHFNCFSFTKTGAIAPKLIRQ